jgi:hypothetical protein
MKKFLITLISLFCFLPTAEAKFDASQLLGGLLEAVSEPQPATSRQQDNNSLAEQLKLTLGGATDALLDAYKQEGREYAREVGDIITQRILEAKKINSTLDSMRFFCWAIVAYLTIVTAIVIYLLLRLRVLHSKLMRAVQKLKVDN